MLLNPLLSPKEVVSALGNQVFASLTVNNIKLTTEGRQCDLELHPGNAQQSRIMSLIDWIHRKNKPLVE